MVQSYNVDHEREVSAAILLVQKPGEFQARAMLVEGGKKHSEDLVVIHVAAVSRDACYMQLKALVLAMEVVISGYPGLGTVQRHIMTTDARGKTGKFDLKHILASSQSERVTAQVFEGIRAKLSRDASQTPQRAAMA